jgi:hypothetical protein
MFAVLYCNGYSKRILDKRFKEQGEISDVLVLYNEKRKKTAVYPHGYGTQTLNMATLASQTIRRKIQASVGLTEDTISEDHIVDQIARVNYPQTRVILMHDTYLSNEVFEDDITKMVTSKAMKCVY